MKRNMAIEKTITTILVIIFTLMLSTSFIFAHDTISDVLFEIPDSASEGQIFINSNGCTEKVVRVNNDGSFVTEEVKENGEQVIKAVCTHPAASLVAITNLTDETKTVGKASCCFKYRSVTQCKCKKCGGLVKTYGAWKSYTKHSYPFLGKTCKTCGYKK